MKRRDFIGQTGLGLAAIGVSGFILRSDARPTPRSMDANEADLLFQEIAGPSLDDLRPTVEADE